MRYLQSTPPFPALPDARDVRDRPPPAPLLAAAMHAQNEGVIITERRWTTAGLKILFANESFCAMTGYTVAELRERGQNFLHEDKASQNKLHKWQSRLTPGMLHSNEGWLTRKNGSRIYASWNYSPVSDERGRVTHIVASYRDLTEKRRLQDELIHSQRLDAVGRLAGGVAHDFNNLLSVINGYCEILAAKRSVRRQAVHELEEIHQASQKAASLVHQLLAFSRRQAMHVKVISLNQLIRDNSEILGRLLKPSKSLELSLADDIGNVRVDPAQLQQVILNLTLNARDALRDGGKVTISTERHEIIVGAKHRPSDPPPGRYTLLSVSDNGVGMDEKTQAHLFEPFFTTKDEGKGTGLGLALVYGVVQQSGGHIRVHSAPGFGSTFDVLLPVVDQPAQPLTTPIPSLPITQGDETVLIVEEDEVLRKMLSGIFTSDGYDVVAAASTAEVQPLLRQIDKQPDLLVIQLDSRASAAGEKLVRTLSAKYPRLRVLATCCPDSPPLDFIPARSQIRLTKPFALSAVMKASRTLLDRKAPARKK